MTTNKEDIIIGIDYGTSRTGVAMGRNGLVCPIRTVAEKNEATTINEVIKTIVQNKATKIVIGIPLNFDGKETVMARKVRGFAKILKSRVKLPVAFVDEYGTSIDSLDESISAGISQKKRKQIDHFSAALILKNFYDGQ